MKVTVWCFGPYLLLVVLSRLFEMDARGHWHQGLLGTLGTLWGAFGGLVFAGYLVFCLFRRIWHGPKAMRDIAAELRTARLDQVAAAGSPHGAVEPDSGRIFGRLQ
jgi:hypothetical protein